MSSLLWVAEGVTVNISMDMVGKKEISNPAGNRIPLIRPVTSLYTSEDTMNLSVYIINEIGSLFPPLVVCLLFYLVRCLVIHIRACY